MKLQILILFLSIATNTFCSSITLKTDSAVATQYFSNDSIKVLKHPKATSAILALTLGMLGVHRIYLGSKPWIPLFYVLSVGGVFFILPITDFIAIVCNKDISKFYKNNKIIMWLD